MFSGSIVALITPFDGDSIDERALARLVRHHLDNGTQGIVPVGTTGESPTLTRAEHERVVEIVVREVGGQVPVIAGAGSNNTAEAIAYNDHAAEVGADGALHVMGYYNRPNQEGIYQHFRALNETSDVPLIVYNIPPRAVIDILPDTMARLSQLNSVVGVKDATRDLSRPLLEGLRIEKAFCFLSGEDATAVAYNANGGNGCISTAANVAPRHCRQMQDACAKGDYGTALELQMRLMPLTEALFAEPSPAGVKYACSLLGLCEPQCRLPIVPLTPATKRSIEEALRGLQLI